MSKQELQAKGSGRWDARWLAMRRGVEGYTETALESQKLWLTHVNFIFKGYEVMAVAKALNDDNQKVVGFHSASDWEACLFGLLRKLEDGTMKWREDKPWKG